MIKGEKIKYADIAVKGPGGGVLPKYIDIIIGRKVKTDIKRDTAINWNDI